jgi:uncharacterized membrane protein YgcG
VTGISQPTTLPSSSPPFRWGRRFLASATSPILVVSAGVLVAGAAWAGAAGGMDHTPGALSSSAPIRTVASTTALRPARSTVADRSLEAGVDTGGNTGGGTSGGVSGGGGSTGQGPQEEQACASRADLPYDACAAIQRTGQ